MSAHAKTICFVTSGSVSHNPRLVKEAMAADLAGYHICIIANQSARWVSEFDQDLFDQYPHWQFKPVCWDGGDFKSTCFRWKTALRQRYCRRLFQMGARSKGVCEKALSRVYPELVKLALTTKADLYIGHNLAALPVVAEASQKFMKPFGFDLEDAHFGEGVQTETQISPLIDYLERMYLPKAVYLSAASPLIAEKYAQRYAMREPISILNVFPLSERTRIDRTQPCQDRKDLTRVSLYWFSQTIGLDRGLQDIIQALKRLNNPSVELHLRGSCRDAVKENLLAPLKDLPIQKHVYFHKQVPPSKLAQRTAEHDIGFACENVSDINRSVCITNKMFFYMLTGLAILATETPGQMSVLNQAPQAGLSYRPGDANGLSTLIGDWVANPGKLREYKKNAWDWGTKKFNWEQESSVFLNAIRFL